MTHLTNPELRTLTADPPRALTREEVTNGTRDGRWSRATEAQLLALLDERDEARCGELEAIKCLKAASAERDRVAAQCGQLLALLKRVQALADDADQGPRSENSSEWRIPWTRYAVEVFADVARALASPPPDLAEVDDDMMRERDAARAEAARLRAVLSQLLGEGHNLKAFAGTMLRWNEPGVNFSDESRRIVEHAESWHRTIVAALESSDAAASWLSARDATVRTEQGTDDWEHFAAWLRAPQNHVVAEEAHAALAEHDAAVRRAALEEAARECDAHASLWTGETTKILRVQAGRLRALATTERSTT